MPSTNFLLVLLLAIAPQEVSVKSNTQHYHQPPFSSCLKNLAFTVVQCLHWIHRENHKLRLHDRSFTRTLKGATKFSLGLHFRDYQPALKQVCRVVYDSRTTRGRIFSA